MVALPVLKSLTFRKYMLYPASLQAPFTCTFEAGPNLIVGVNGSGKTTFIMAALRCLTGPYELPEASSETELGQVRPRPRRLSKLEREAFARRVADGAQDAFATLILDIGNTTIEIKRSLANLALAELRIGGRRVDCEPTHDKHQGEVIFQETLCELFGVGAFFDVLIILHYLVFMLEDRRALVWDPTAQRQIFRVLLLPPDRAAEHARAQQAIISADSAVRNTRNIIRKYEKELADAAKPLKTITDVEAARRAKAAEAAATRERLEEAAKARVEADGNRQSARLAHLRAAEARDSAVRELEQLKMEALRHWLGPSNDTLRYIIGHMLADGRCLVCNTDPAPSAHVMEHRLRTGLCPLCGSEHVATGKATPILDAHRSRIEQLEAQIQLTEKQLAETEARTADALSAFDTANAKYQALETKSAELDRDLVILTRKLPTKRPPRCCEWVS